MKKYFALFLLMFSLSGFAQNTINNYKYIVVPEKFSFLKEEDQYNLNTLAKNLLADKGFTVYFDNADLPAEIAGNRCNALNLEVLGKSTMFSTNLTLLLKDCKGAVIFKGKEGKSREKEYETAYSLALRDAFTSLNDVQYVYTAAAKPEPATTNEIMVVQVEQEPPLVVETTAATLYAQPTANGFQLVDSTPKIILTLFKTSLQGYFIASNGLSNGIFFKKKESWFFEYYKDGKLVAEPLAVKF